MAEFFMHVPLIAQQKSMTCWFASACMVKCYKKMQTVTGLPDYYNANLGLQPLEVTKLAKVEGFQIIQHSRNKFTVETLITTLRNHGPLWVNTINTQLNQHAIVLTGASNQYGFDEVLFNDPGPVGVGEKRTLPIEEMNDLLGPQLLWYPSNV